MTWNLASALRIALLDDHAVVRYGLAKRLAEEPDFTVVGAFATSKELMAALRASPADLLLIDYSLGSNDIDGLNLIRALRVRFSRSKIPGDSAHSRPGNGGHGDEAGGTRFRQQMAGAGGTDPGHPAPSAGDGNTSTAP